MRKWSRLARRQTHSTDVSDSDTPPDRELPHTDRGGATTSACRIAVFSRERCPSGLGAVLAGSAAREAEETIRVSCEANSTAKPPIDTTGSADLPLSGLSLQCARRTIRVSIGKACHFAVKVRDRYEEA